MRANTLVLTAAAMAAFAANSILCRLALGVGLIDAASFATIRTISGALVLAGILLLRQKPVTARPDWRSVLALYLYMVFFAFAYLSLSAGTGALILFGAVQLTMFTVALRNGEHFPAVSWAGLALAIGGLVYLVSPGNAGDRHQRGTQRIRRRKARGHEVDEPPDGEHFPAVSWAGLALAVP